MTFPDLTETHAAQAARSFSDQVPYIVDLIVIWPPKKYAMVWNDRYGQDNWYRFWRICLNDFHRLCSQLLGLYTGCVKSVICASYVRPRLCYGLCLCVCLKKVNNSFYCSIILPYNIFHLCIVWFCKLLRGFSFEFLFLQCDQLNCRAFL